MLSQFILIAVFVHGHGPRINYANLGEYNSMAACQTAASATLKAEKEFDLWGGMKEPKFICAAKG